METADIGRFNMSNVRGSNVTVGHYNGVGAPARRLTDPVQDGSSFFDLSLEETPWHYKSELSVDELVRRMTVYVRMRRASLLKERESLKERLLDDRSLKESIDSTERRLRELEAFDRSMLKSKDVDVQFGNRTVVDVHQIVDLKIFVNIGGKAGWVNLQHRVKLPKDAKLDERDWSIRDGVLTITLPKGSTFNEGEGKRRRRPSEAVKEECIHEYSRRRR